MFSYFLAHYLDHVNKLTSKNTVQSIGGIQMMFKIVVIVGLLWGVAQAGVLASADFVNYAQDPWAYSYGNPVGLSMDLSEFIPEMNNNLLQLYLLNSNVYGDWYSNFEITFHNPGGYKYNCTLMDQIANETLSCVYDINNSTFISALGRFIWNTTMSSGMAIGWDNEAADFSSSDYMNNFVKFIKALRSSAQQSFITQVSDKADTYNQTGLRPGYSFTQPAADCSSLNMYLYYLYSAPGLTPAASSQWYSQIGDVGDQCGVFTLRGTVFQNPSLLTISNLLSQNYTSEYIKRRFTINGTSFLSKLQSNLVSFNELRLVDAPEGVDGLTNSFAAAIWAIEFVMEWLIVGGFRTSFYNPISNSSFQSVLGKSPTYAPSSLYYGLLMAITANTRSPWIMRPTMTSGTSLSIKAYGLDDYGQYSFLLLNKDTNPNASGTVDVKISYTNGITCMYLSAANLSSTEGISFNGFTFVSNTSTPVGNFISKTIDVNDNNVYSVPLNYSQVALCRSIASKSYRFFPRRSRTSGELWVQAGLMLVIMLLWS